MQVRSDVWFRALSELRKRIALVLCCWVLLALASYSQKEAVFAWVARPAIESLLRAGRRMSALSPAELFVSYIQASLLVGFVASLPFTSFQLWRVVERAGLVRSSRLAVPFVMASVALFLLGDAFGYALVFPMVFEYFLSLEGHYVVTQWTSSTVLGFMIQLYVGFGLAFQLPLVLVTSTALGVVSVDQIVRARRVAIVCMFVVGGVLTPSPDIVSQLSLALPLLALYELGLLGARAIQKRKRVG